MGGRNCWQELCGSKGKVVVSMNIFVVKAWKIVAIYGSKFIQCCQTGSSKTRFGYQNYMGEVSRLLIASPGQ